MAYINKGSAAFAKSQITRVNKRLKRELEVYQSELESIEEGKLYMRSRNGKIQFNECRKGRQIGITRNPERIYELARRMYIFAVIKIINWILCDGWHDHTEKIIAGFFAEIEEMLQNFQTWGLDIGQIVLTENQRIWNSDRSSKNSMYGDDLQYGTKGGIFMRTKSERFIGNLLEALQFSFRYEPELIINGIVFHPDFVIMLPDNRMVIIEHVGRMDLDNYDANLIGRLQAYNDAGLLIGRNIFFTFEMDIKNENRVKEILFQAQIADAMDNSFLRAMAEIAGCRFQTKN